MSRHHTTATKPKAQRKKGAPSKYTPALAARLCAELACGKSLSSVCKMEGMPRVRTVFDWLRGNLEFRELYERAKREGAEAWAEEILDISDDGSNDFYVDEDGNEKVNHENIQRSRLRVDSRKWLMSKLLPKKYGDKVDLHHGTVEGDPLQQLIAAVQGQTFGPVQKCDGEDDDDA